jgi:Protein of unknown function (DUF2924)
MIGMEIIPGQLGELTVGRYSAFMLPVEGSSVAASKSATPSYTRAFDPGGMLKTGATLVRQWRGRTHTVLVREDGFEYDGERYRSLTVIAERITGAHWSGPRFFGLTKRARAF